MTLVQTPSDAPSRRSMLLERFVDRVATLTAPEWGRLDAMAERLTAPDPVARWARARRTAALFATSRVPETLAVVLTLVVEAASDVVAGLRGRTRWGPGAPAVPVPPTGGSPEMEHIAAQLARLRDVGELQPGRPGRAMYCVLLAVAALLAHEQLPRAVLERLYEPMQPVIPFESL